MNEEDHIWEIRNPDGGMLGLEFAKAVMAGRDLVLAHALPERIDVEVRSPAGRRIAQGRNLADPHSSPIARLRIEGGGVSRANAWPAQEDIGLPVILAGGEVGILCEWWNADDKSEWRWKVEFSNHT